jgi:hypothetical protein
MNVHPFANSSNLKYHLYWLLSVFNLRYKHAFVNSCNLEYHLLVFVCFESLHNHPFANICIDCFLLLIFGNFKYHLY